MNGLVLDRPHILVIDDDDRLRKLLVKFLSDHDFMVTGAKDAADARGRLVGLEFDLIVLDLMMPEKVVWILLNIFARQDRCLF